METIMQLPLEVSATSRDWKTQKIILMGMSGIGKSEFFAQDAGSFFIDAEGNLNHLAVKKLPCRSWGDLIDIYGLLYEAMRENKFPYSTIIVDTFDRIYSYAIEEVLDRARNRFKKVEINGIGDIPEGVGWYMLGQLLLNFLIKIEEFPCAKALICHVNNKEIKEPTRIIHKDTINIGGQAGTNTLAWANHILHIKSRLMGTELQRTVYTLPSDGLEAKSQGAICPNGASWGVNAKENWEALRKLFTG